MRQQLIRSIATLAYVWGYALLLMERERRRMIGSGRHQFPLNTFNHARHLMTPRYRGVILPNNDTLYSLAWLDLQHEPVLLEAPNTQDRYYVLPLMDMYQNIIASLGRRQHGTATQRWVVTGPGWCGELPAGIPVVRVPTNDVWIIGRILVDGESDLPAVRQLQEGFAARPLSVALGQRAPEFRHVDFTPLQNDPLDVFAEIARVWQRNPHPPSEQALVDQFALLGLRPDRPFDARALDPQTRAVLEAAVRDGQAAIEEAAVSWAGDAIDGWIIPKAFGFYGTDYLNRAVVAHRAIGAQDPAEATYPLADTDAQGRVLDGTHNYRLRFPAGKLPPVDAFWSLTLYGPDFFLVENPIARYSLGDRTPGLQFDDDGALVLHIRSTPPTAGSSNWLPAPPGRFYLVMRLYQPRNAVLNGSYRLPGVERVD